MKIVSAWRRASARLRTINFAVRSALRKVAASKASRGSTNDDTAAMPLCAWYGRAAFGAHFPKPKPRATRATRAGIERDAASREGR